MRILKFYIAWTFGIFSLFTLNYIVIEELKWNKWSLEVCVKWGKKNEGGGPPNTISEVVHPTLLPYFLLILEASLCFFTSSSLTLGASLSLDQLTLTSFFVLLSLNHCHRHSFVTPPSLSLLALISLARCHPPSQLLVCLSLPAKSLSL